jgi:antitoxin MazE
MRTQVGKWGNSLAVRIPRGYVQEMKLKEGMDLDVSFADGELILRPIARAYSLDELVRGITPENRHDETDWGESVGKESW